MIRSVKRLFGYDGVRGLTLTIAPQNVYNLLQRKTLVCIESAGVVSLFVRISLATGKVPYYKKQAIFNFAISFQFVFSFSKIKKDEIGKCNKSFHLQPHLMGLNKKHWLKTYFFTNKLQLKKITKVLKQNFFKLKFVGEKIRFQPMFFV